jgi:hydrogenase maturation factor
MNPAEYHTKYALPCVEGKQRQALEQSLRKRDFLSEQELEEITPKAIQRIKDFAEKIGYGNRYWSLEVVKKYWLQEHNNLIDKKEDGFDDKNHTDASREFCKVSLSEVRDVKGNGMNYKVKVFVYGKELELESIIKPNIGDKVTVHKGMVIEILDNEDIEKYFSNLEND